MMGKSHKLIICIICGQALPHCAKGLCRKCHDNTRQRNNFTELTAEYLQTILQYNHETGDFIWIKSKGGMSKGKAAGTITKNGYIHIGIDEKHYLAHRLAWLYVNKCWPDIEIDHIDGVRRNNRWDNLRQVNRSVNNENTRKARSDNSSSLLGVELRKNRGKPSWVSRIKVRGKVIYLGTFSTPEDAYEAYLKAKRILHKGCTI